MTGPSKKLGPRVTVSVTPGDYSTLCALADHDDVSVSWVVRRAIQEFLQRHRQPAQAVRRSTLDKRPVPERT